MNYFALAVAGVVGLSMRKSEVPSDSQLGNMLVGGAIIGLATMSKGGS